MIYFHVGQTIDKSANTYTGVLLEYIIRDPVSTGYRIGLPVVQTRVYPCTLPTVYRLIVVEMHSLQGYRIEIVCDVDINLKAV